MTIKINPKKIGTLHTYASKNGGVRKDGKISVVWARRKLKDAKTSSAIKKKINFFLNFGAKK